MKKALIINGSHRKESSTNILVNKFKEEISDVYEVSQVDLFNRVIEYYNYDNYYSDEDDFENLKNQIFDADLVVFSSPIYWYSMSARLKTFFDRFGFIMYTDDKDKLFEKKVILLFTYGAKSYDESFVKPFELTFNYLNMNYIGSFSVQSKFPVGIKNEGDLNDLSKFVESILNTN